MQAVGEPPLFLAASVLFAIRDAVTASREERGITTPFQLHTPATCEAIRLACVDQFTQQVFSCSMFWLYKLREVQQKVREGV